MQKMCIYEFIKKTVVNSLHMNITVHFYEMQLYFPCSNKIHEKGKKKIKKDLMIQCYKVE